MTNPVLLDVYDDPEAPGQPSILRIACGDHVKVCFRNELTKTLTAWVKITHIEMPPLFKGRTDLSKSQLNQIRLKGTADASDAGACFLPEGEFQFLVTNILALA